MLTLDEYTVMAIFDRLKDADGNPVYWRSVADEGNGYVLVWPNGEHHHTYWHPEEIMEPWPWGEDEGCLS